MNKITINLFLLLLFTGGILSCNSTYQLNTLEELSVLRKEDIIPYIEIKNNFKYTAQQVLQLLKQSPKVKQSLSNKQHLLLIEQFPTLTQPLFIVNIRHSWNGQLKRLVTFRVNANTGTVQVASPLFSDAYNNGIFHISLQEWEKQ
jgi:hypothetical protein